jgi:hypothetical protein
LEDKELLWETTPPEIRTAIPHVFVAISDLEKTFFKNLNHSTFAFSKAAERIKKNAEDREAKKAAEQAKAATNAPAADPSPEKEEEE